MPKIEIDVTSPNIEESVNPPPFTGEKAWDFDVTKSPEPDKHFVMLYKDAVDSNFTIQNFSIKLKANIGPGLSSSAINARNPRWEKLDGPSSGSLSSTTGVEVNFENPKVGGVYKFAFDLDGFKRTEFCVVLPLAGAEMDGVMQANLSMADAFVGRMTAKYSPRQLRHENNLRKWFFDFNAGDYTGRPDNQLTPSVWYYGQVQTVIHHNPNDEKYGLGAVCTWMGRPVRMAKMSNFIVGYTQQKLGVSKNTVQAGAARYGTKDGPTGTESIGVGWDVAKDGNYSTKVSALVNYIWTNENANDKTKKPWPNPNPPDNYGGSSTHDLINKDSQYSVPGFLFMIN